MKIYVAHSKNYDYQNELYIPIRQSSLNNEYEFILPHENSETPFNSRDLLKNHGCDIVLAEVSFPATGQGIELGWADAYEIPIVCIYKQGSKISGSLKVVTQEFVEYTDPHDMINKIETLLQKYGKSQN